MLAPVTRLGEDAELTIVDSSRYAAQGEALNFWQLMVREPVCCRREGHTSCMLPHLPCIKLFVMHMHYVVSGSR